MALLVCSILLGLQALPGIFKPYSKGVGMMLTKPPADQKGKDMLMIFHHFLSFGRLKEAVKNHLRHPAAPNDDQRAVVVA